MNSRLHRTIVILVILLATCVLSSCTIMQHKYGEGSVIIMLGDQTYKVDAKNDFETAIKDLIPEGVFKGLSEVPVEGSGRTYPSITVKYNTLPKEAEK